MFPHSWGVNTQIKNVGTTQSSKRQEVRGQCEEENWKFWRFYLSFKNTPHCDRSVHWQVVNVLRAQLAQLDEIKKERETMEAEIKAVTFDMSTTFLTALAQDGAINEEQLSLPQLDQMYGSYNQRVQASLRSQEELLGQVQVNKWAHRVRYKSSIEQEGDSKIQLYHLRAAPQHPA